MREGRASRRAERLRESVIQQRTRRWLGAGVGGVFGLVAGAIASVNLVIFGGTPDGYQTGVTELFDYSPVLGTFAAVLLIAGPVIGVLLGLRVVRGGRRGRNAN